MRSQLLAFMPLTLFAGASLVVSAADAASSDPALLLVPESSGELVQQLQDADITVVEVATDHVLALADSREDMESLRQLGRVAHVLDRSTDGKTYYTVIPRSARSWRALARVDVLYRESRDGSGYAIVEADEDEIGFLSAEGAEVAQIRLRAVRTRSPHPARESFSRRDGVDPWVEAQVALIEGGRVDSNVQRLQDFVTRYANSDSCFAAAEWIADQFRSYGIDDVSFHSFDSRYGPNVVAVIPGIGSPDEQIVIGGHYDSITSNHSLAPGADDNASGTAGVLECARVLAQGEFNRTIVVIAYGGEELGLLGSYAYTEEAAMRGDDIVASIAVDMIGYLASGDARDLDVISNNSSEWLRTLVIETAAQYVPSTSSVPGTLPSGASSDHYPYWQAGYDAVLLFEDSGNYSPYIHTSNDVVGVSYNSPELALASTQILTAVTTILAGPFEIAIAHEPLTDTEDTNSAYRVEATIRSAYELDPNALLVQGTTSDGPFSESLLPTGTEDVYEAFIQPQPAGTFVEYYIEASDLEGHHLTAPSEAPTSMYRFFVGTTDIVFADDFENDLGWTVGSPDDNATTGLWVRADPVGSWDGDRPVQPEDDHTADPGTYCYITGNGPVGGAQGDQDVDGGKTTLTSPRIDLTDANFAWIRYHRWYTNDTGGGPETDDWIVDASNDDGNTWTRLEITRSSLRNWAQIDVELSTLLPLTEQMRFRFIATDDDPGSIVEAAIDDLEVRAFFEDSSQVGPGPNEPLLSGLSILSCRPNPFQEELAIQYYVPEGTTDASLGLYDANGRLVQNVPGASLEAGIHKVVLGGADVHGRALPSGIYFLRLDDGHTQRVDRIVRIR
ncbi:MAG: M20/M25/M40 family metallo-hydrolase [Candidatus Eisenbacteria bacterium]